MLEACSQHNPASGAGSPPQLSSLGHRPYAQILGSQQEMPVAVFRSVTIYALKLYRKKAVKSLRSAGKTTSYGTTKNCDNLGSEVKQRLPIFQL